MLRRKDDAAKQLEYKLGAGACLLMAGHTQTFWQHSVPSRKGAMPRINLTFRRVVGGRAAGGAAAAPEGGGAAAGRAEAEDDAAVIVINDD